MLTLTFSITAFALMYGSGLGVTMGAHRLWSHRAFKAKTPLRIFLLWLHTLAGQVRIDILSLFNTFTQPSFRKRLFTHILMWQYVYSHINVTKQV